MVGGGALTGMTSPTIVRERESTSGWAFTIRVQYEGTARLHEATLSWADYNLWSPAGADTPSAVMQAAFQFLTARGHADDLPERFDASLARRLHADADVVVPTLIHR